jgi:hypothetical protein
VGIAFQTELPGFLGNEWSKNNGFQAYLFLSPPKYYERIWNLTFICMACSRRLPVGDSYLLLNMHSLHMLFLKAAISFLVLINYALQQPVSKKVARLRVLIFSGGSAL